MLTKAQEKTIAEFILVWREEDDGAVVVTLRGKRFRIERDGSAAEIMLDPTQETV
jgi:hypothetical protein